MKTVNNEPRMEHGLQEGGSQKSECGIFPSAFSVLLSPLLVLRPCFIRVSSVAALMLAMMCGVACEARPPYRPRPKPPVPTPTPTPAPLPAPTPATRPPLPPEVRGDGSSACSGKPAWAGAAVCLGSCIQLKDYPAGTVEIEWVQIESLDAAGNVLATKKTFGRDIWGELDTRYPFWGIGGTNKVEAWQPREAIGNSLLIHPNLRADKIWHFWGAKVALAAGTNKIRTSARVKITGGALFSIGSDWWRGVNNTSSVWGPCNSTDPKTTNTDGPQSRWHSLENQNWQTIVVEP